MEEIQVDSSSGDITLNVDNSSKKFSLKKTTEILATDFDRKLSMKNGLLLNGLQNCRDDEYQFENGQTAETTTNHHNKNEDCLCKAAALKMEQNSSHVVNHSNSSEEHCLCKLEDCNEIATSVVVEKQLDETELCESSKALPPIEYVQYESEFQMPMIMKIIQKDLSEPYSIYTYRYFIHNWPKLCFLAMCEGECVGAIVCKLDLHRKLTRRGYIAMLAVDEKHRKRSIGSTLVRRAIEEMIAGDADEVVLETEVTNKPALRLYEALGFVRDKRLFRYYLNGVDALRLKLWLR